MDTVPKNGVFIFIVVVQTLVIARLNKVSLNSMERSWKSLSRYLYQNECWWTSARKTLDFPVLAKKSIKIDTKENILFNIILCKLIHFPANFSTELGLLLPRVLSSICCDISWWYCSDWVRQYLKRSSNGWIWKVYQVKWLKPRKT